MIEFKNAKSGEYNGNMDKILANIRVIRAETQNLKKTVSEIKEIKEKSNLTTQSVLPDLKNKLYQIKSNELFKSNSEQIRELFESIKEILNESPAIYDDLGDDITDMDNLWERIRLFWPILPAKKDYNLNKKDSFDLNEFCLHIDVIESMMNDLVFRATKLTIPHRVNHRLDLLGVGQPLNFHETFEKELPNHDERVEVLRYIYSKPKLVKGVVDVENGRIYRASPNKIRRYGSYVLIIGFVLLGGFLVYLFANMKSLGITGLTVPYGLNDLLAGYLFIIFGAIVHIGIDGIKQYRANKGQTFLAIEDWLLWIHVNEVSIIVGVISLWIGFFGLVLLGSNISSQSLWQIAFFVGYSIDSFVDIFLERFTNTASTRTEFLKQQFD